MTPQRWQRIKSLMASTLERPTAERALYLAEVCRGHDDLREEVESLLHADRQAASFLEPPVPRLASGQPERYLEAGDRVGPYKVVRELGRGGMGAVYLALRVGDEYRNHVAVKVMQPGLESAEIVRRFRAEGKILADLRHPHIARLLDGGTACDGSPFLVLEHVEGEPIDRFCERRRLPTGDRLRLLRDVCSAVAFAHSKLVVHRDLKPSNILVTAAGVPKLLDFGIAKGLSPAAPATEQPTTAPGLRPMTPEYAAPEQFRGAAITTATDVYSLGVVLHRLLTGELPERAEHRHRAAGATDLATLPGPRNGTKPLPSDLTSIIAMAMREEPEARYRSVEQLAADLERYLEGRPVAARRGSSLYRLGKFIRRHRAGLAASCALLLLLTGFAWSMWREKQATARERDRAEAVTEFLIEMFRSADPGQARGASITAREVLERGSRRLRDGLADQPALAATLLETIARVEMSLSLYAQARQSLEQAVDLRRRHAGERSAETAASLDLLGALLQLQGDYDAGEAIHRRVLEIHAALRPANRRDVARTSMLLGASLLYQARLDEAEQWLHRALSIYRDVAAEDPGIVETIFYLAILLTQKGEPEAAEAMAGRALELSRAVHGESHPMSANLVDHLAALRRLRGDLAGAEILARRALTQRRRIFGDDHYDVAQTLNVLAQVIKDRGRYDEAEQLYIESLDIARRTLGDDHPDVAVAINNLAVLLHSIGDYPAAEPLYREALAIHRQIHGDQHSSVANTTNNLAFLLAERGDCDAAEELHRKALATRQHLFGNEHPHVANSLANLGIALAAQGRHAEAEAAYDEAQRILELAFGRPHPQLAAVLGNRASLLVAQGKWAASEQLIHEALAMQRSLLGERHPALAKSLHVLISIRLRQGRFLEARSLARESLALLRASAPRDQRRQREAAALLAAALRGLGRDAANESLPPEQLRLLLEAAEEGRRPQACR